jgi:hypothetical protein
MHYGSTNEEHKITYGQPALASCFKKRELFQVRTLQNRQETARGLFILRFLPGKKGSGLGKKSGEEAKES